MKKVRKITLRESVHKGRAYEYCMKCRHFSHGKCFAYNAGGIIWIDVYNTFGLKYRNQCEYFMSREDADWALTMALAVARDAKVHNDRKLAEAAIVRLADCKRLLLNADFDRIAQEIYELRTSFNIEAEKYISESDIYRTANETEKIYHDETQKTVLRHTV